jgi:hypothetical protein
MHAICFLAEPSDHQVQLPDPHTRVFVQHDDTRRVESVWTFPLHRASGYADLQSSLSRQ